MGLFVFKFNACEFLQDVRSYVFTSRDMLDLYPVKFGLYDIIDQGVVLK